MASGVRDLKSSLHLLPPPSTVPPGKADTLYPNQSSSHRRPPAISALRLHTPASPQGHTPAHLSHLSNVGWGPGAGVVRGSTWLLSGEQFGPGQRSVLGSVWGPALPCTCPLPKPSYLKN